MTWIDGKMEEVPDSFEPIIALRGFTIRDYGLLRSPRLTPLTKSSPWHRGVNKAACNQAMGSGWALGKHEAPHQECACGFWAFPDPLSFIRNANSYLISVLGIVKLWGRVVVGSEGYRSEFAQILAILPNELTTTMDPIEDWAKTFHQLSRKYRVPAYSTPFAWTEGTRTLFMRQSFTYPGYPGYDDRGRAIQASWSEHWKDDFKDIMQ